MTTCTNNDSQWIGFHGVAESHALDSLVHRIAEVFKINRHKIPPVQDATLAKYYKYLSAKLILPWTAYYPEPETPEEKIQYRCRILNLLDPSKYLGDIMDGIFCQVRKEEYEFNLPLIDLHLASEHPNEQWIKDFQYWLWNWR